MSELIPVVAGFLLTTVLGGLFGFLLQKRSWNHQHSVQFAERERERAVRIFEEVSRLLDKRLYRLKLLHWTLQEQGGDSSSDSEVSPSSLLESRMNAYREILSDWNDSINRNLALIQQYFGGAMRSRLDNEIGAMFVELGRQVEERWKHRAEPQGQQADPVIDRRLEALGGLVYFFSLDMIQAVQRGQVGLLVAGAELGSGHRSKWRGRQVADRDVSGPGA